MVEGSYSQLVQSLDSGFKIWHIPCNTERSMKKHFILLTIIFFGLLQAKAQKFGYVDSEFILSKIPEFAEAQKEIDKLSIKYQKEIIGMKKSIDSLENIFTKEEILYTEEMKRKKTAEIEKKTSDLSEYQNSIFGYEGRIFLKRQELIRPIQDQVFESVEKVAKKHKLQFVFDKAGDLTILYASATHDYTDFVLEDLGLADPVDIIDNKR